MRTLAAVIGALGLAAAVATTAPAKADPFVDGGYHPVREHVVRAHEWRAHHRWHPVHFVYRSHHRHYVRHG